MRIRNPGKHIRLNSPRESLSSYIVPPCIYVPTADDPPPPKKKPTGENQDSDLLKRQQHTIGMFSVVRKGENNLKIYLKCKQLQYLTVQTYVLVFTWMPQTGKREEILQEKLSTTDCLRVICMQKNGKTLIVAKRRCGSDLLNPDQ